MTNSTKKDQKRTLRLTSDQVAKAIEVSNGNLHAACRLFKYPDGAPVGWTSFYHYVRKFNLHLQLDKYRERVAYEALEAVTLASKNNWRAALALLDRFGAHLGSKGDVSSSQRLDEANTKERIEDWQDYEIKKDPGYITRLDVETLDLIPPGEQRDSVMAI